MQLEILKVKKSYAYGKVLEILTESKNRTENNCPHFQKCGGCVFRHISYTAECSLKSNKVYEAIKRIGSIDLKPQPIMSLNPDRYRNKAQYPVSLDGRVGFFAFHSHRIIPCDDCKLQPEVFSQIIAVTEDWIKEYNIFSTCQ